MPRATSRRRWEDSGTRMAAAPQAPNWDDPSNPYRTYRDQYAGLQGNFKQVAARLQQQEQYAAELTEKHALLQAQLNGATPEEITNLKDNLGAKRAIENMFMGVLSEKQQIEQAKRGLAQPAKMILVGQIAKQFGVQPQDIMDADTPQEAVRLAQKLGAARKTTALEDRKRDNVDQTETGGGGDKVFRSKGALDQAFLNNEFGDVYSAKAAKKYSEHLTRLGGG